MRPKNNIKWNKLTQTDDSRIQIDWNKGILDSDDDILVEELSDDDLYYSEEENLDTNENVLSLDTLEVEPLELE